MQEAIQQWADNLEFPPEWLSGYGAEELRSDTVAGVTVGVMLIPQGMAHAIIAGLPPIYGLYAALVPLLAYPLFASSRHLAFGPSAVDMVIVAAGVGAMAEVGTDEYITLAILLTLMVGLLQVIMGVMKLGFIANFLSRPVIAGLTFGAAIIIGFSQFDELLGVELSQTQYVYLLFYEAIQQIEEVHVLSLVVGLASIAILIGIPYLSPKIPTALVVVIIGALAGWLLDLQDRGVSVVADIPAGLPDLSAPGVSLGSMQSLLPTAIALALVQFMKNVSLGRIFAARHNYSIDPNRVLVAGGVANIVGSFFRSPPAGGSFSRTAVNDRSGARSPLSNVFAAGVIALTLLFLTPLFYHLPMPVLAAIIMVAGFSLIDIKELRTLFRTNKRDGYIALFTAGCVLLLGIQEGILLGIGATVIAVLYRISRPNVAELGHVPGTRLFRDLDRFGQAVQIGDILLLRVDASFSFANAEYFKNFILEKSKRGERDVRAVVIDGTSINALDTTAVDAFRSVIEDLEERDIEIHLTGLIGPVREVIVRSGLYDELGEDHFHMDPHEAVVHLLRKWDEADEGDRLEEYQDEVEEERESTPTAS